MKPNKSKIISAITIGGIVLAFITGILTFDGRYAKISQVEAGDKQVEKRVALTLESFEKQMDKKFEAQRYQSLTDRYYQLKSIVNKNPNDQESKQDLEDVKKERDESKKKLDDVK